MCLRAVCGVFYLPCVGRSSPPQSESVRCGKGSYIIIQKYTIFSSSFIRCASLHRDEHLVISVSVSRITIITTTHSRQYINNNNNNNHREKKSATTLYPRCVVYERERSVCSCFLKTPKSHTIYIRNKNAFICNSMKSIWPKASERVSE